MRRDNSNYSYEIKEFIVEFIWCGNPFRFLWMQRIPIKEETEQIKSVVTFWLYSGGENYASHCSVCVLVFFQCVCICCASVCFKVWRARMDPFIFHRAYIIQKPSLYSTPIFSRVASLAFVSGWRRRFKKNTFEENRCNLELPLPSYIDFFKTILLESPSSPVMSLVYLFRLQYSAHRGRTNLSQCTCSGRHKNSNTVAESNIRNYNTVSK